MLKKSTRSGGAQRPPHCAICAVCGPTGLAGAISHTWGSQVILFRKDPDDALLDRILAELSQRAPVRGDTDSDFVRRIRELPRGLRAMAATHWLDISLTLDDIGWHFLNFGEPELVEETERGLRELGLVDLANVFREAHTIVGPLLKQFAGPNQEFEQLLSQAGVEERVDELSDHAWDLMDRRDIHTAWIDYAKRRPNDVFGAGSMNL